MRQKNAGVTHPQRSLTYWITDAEARASLRDQQGKVLVP